MLLEKGALFLSMYNLRILNDATRNNYKQDLI